MVPTAEELASRCAGDGEFRLAARFWTGGLRLEIGGTITGISMVGGAVRGSTPEPGRGVITITGSAAGWEPLFLTVPPRFYNDVSAVISAKVLERRGDELTWWQYYPAIQRAIELLREPGHAAPGVVMESAGVPRYDSPVGRYVHVELGGLDHRIYFEEFGQGIPILLQHTAGSHGSQWRHLFENTAITDHFRLIAYDLPFHGKSIPPVDRRWWEEQYKLTGEFLRSVPRAVSDALFLDRPVFMGCSVGGLLALDLALRHPDDFRAVVSIEGALHIGGDPERLVGFWHPQVSNQSKARMMEGLTSPTSPDPYRKETTQLYSAGWPQAFMGDLHYYMADYDLRESATAIDTTRVGVHIMSGEYDYSATMEKGREAHESIVGSTFTEMLGVGHFPMSENPEAFMKHLMPLLEQIRA